MKALEESFAERDQIRGINHSTVMPSINGHNISNGITASFSDTSSLPSSPNLPNSPTHFPPSHRTGRPISGGLAERMAALKNAGLDVSPVSNSQSNDSPHHDQFFQ